MNFFRQKLHALILPTGRAGRSELLVVAGVLLGLQLIVSGAQTSSLPVPEILAYGLHGVIGWIGLVATVRRLHDVGYSAWWVPGGFAVLCIWSVAVAMLAMMTFGADAIHPTQSTYAVILGLLFLPLLGAMLWLHLTPSDPLPNRFGLPVEGEGAVQPTSTASASTDMKLT
jgi:uncharacterized membrane protein YhaH (DUF805 family)